MNLLSLTFCSSFLSGTLLVESILKILSRASVSQKCSAWYPYLPALRFKKSSGRKSDNDGVRNSFVQSQHLALLVASLMHASFFVMMGTRSGYPLMFVAYVVSAFARAIITGEFLSRLRIHVDR